MSRIMLVRTGFTAALLWIVPPAAAQRIMPWTPGTLDIHHISTGRGNAAFAILPDGTTLLIDAGALSMEDKGRRYAPALVAPARPDGRRSPGRAIIAYVRSAMAPRPARIDYAILTHFHEDHYGRVTPSTPRSRSGAFRLSGITEVGDAISIGSLITHAAGLQRLNGCAREQALGDYTYGNLRAFIAEKVRTAGLRERSLAVGRDDQIVPVRAPSARYGVSVFGLKADATIWTGTGSETRELFDVADTADARCGHNENALSLALLIRFGRFAYYTGGDNGGIADPGKPAWLDVETPLAAVTGPVDVITLNHHGNRDATNAAFLAALRPRVIVQQSWISDQPGGEVVHRLASKELYPGPRTILSTHLASSTKAAIGHWLTDAFAAPQGHVLIRVTDSGARYRAYVLDDRRRGQVVRRTFGPFTSGAN